MGERLLLLLSLVLDPSLVQHSVFLDHRNRGVTLGCRCQLHMLLRIQSAIFAMLGLANNTQTTLQTDVSRTRNLILDCHFESHKIYNPVRLTILTVADIVIDGCSLYQRQIPFSMPTSTTDISINAQGYDSHTFTSKYIRMMRLYFAFHRVMVKMIRCIGCCHKLGSTLSVWIERI
jgi:hypothetical protein